MSLKLPSIFIIGVLCLISIHLVYATTADELLKHNPTAMDIQNAVDNGSINYSDLPPTFQINIHDHPIDYNKWLANHSNNTSTDSSDTTQPKSSPDYIGFLIPLVGILIPVSMLVFRSLVGGGSDDDEERHKPNRLHKALFHIGLAKKVDDGETERFSDTISKDKDMTSLDDTITEHDYSEPRTKKRENRKTKHKEVTIKPHHNLLISLGLAKVVKKDD